VPTELRWNRPHRSRPSAIAACNEGTGWATAGRSSGGLTGGSASIVSSNDRRDNMPSVNGWFGGSSAAGCLPWALSCAMSPSGRPRELSLDQHPLEGKSRNERRPAGRCGAVIDYVLNVGVGISASKVRDRAAALRGNAYAVCLAARDLRVPWYAKAFVLMIAAYVVSPIDLVPDFIPVLGQVDDAILVPLGIFVAMRLVATRGARRAPAPRCDSR
jgi:uncharacterized membrane protein YkvA (DUF1232 family)